MANTIEYAKIFTQALDAVLEQAPVTAWMTANAGRVQYNGGNEFKLAKLTLDGLSDYDRSTGFVNGNATLEWETKKFKYDRGRKFRIDAMDVDETNFVLNATTLLNEFARTKVAPEVDTVRIAELASVGAEVTAGTDALDTLRKAIVSVRNTGYDGQLVAHVTFDFLAQVEAEAVKHPGLMGTITFNGMVFPALQGVALIPTVKERMLSAVKKDDLTKAIVKGDTAKNLSLLITGVDVPLGIVKHNPFKIITPEANQEADAYDIHYRAYHTLEVEDNKKKAVFYVVSA